MSSTDEQAVDIDISRSTAEITSWVLEHFAVRLRTVPAHQAALYSRLHDRLAPYSPKFDRKADYTLASCFLHIRKQLIPPQYNHAQQDQYIRILEIVFDIERLRRSRTESVIETWRKEDEVTARKGKRKISSQGEADGEGIRRIDRLTRISVSLESTFEAAVLAFKRQLVLRSLYAAPFSSSNSFALLNILIPNAVADKQLTNRWCLPMRHYPSHELRAKLIALIDKVDEFIDMHTAIFYKKRRGREGSDRAEAMHADRAQNSQLPENEQRERIKSYPTLRLFDAELTWEQACGAILSYLAAAEKFIVQTMSSEVCRRCGEKNCPGLNTGQTIVGKICEEES